MYLGEPLDGYITYLNLLLDTIADNPYETPYVENILDTKIKSNIEFYIYTYLYSKVNYNINKVFSDYENTLTSPFKNRYIDAKDIINNINNPLNTVILYSYDMLYSKYNLEKEKHNFFINNIDMIFNRIYMLMFTFNAQDINLNIGEIVNIILEFCEATNTSPLIFMNTIDLSFVELINTKADSISSSISNNIPLNNKLPTVSSLFVINEFAKYKNILNSQIIDYDNRYVVSQIILHKAYKVKELITEYSSDFDDTMFRSYIIIAISRFINIFIENNTMDNNDLINYIALNNVMILCSKLKVHIVSMFDYNYIKGII